MLPNVLDNRNVQIPYAFVKLEESARVIKLAINELPLLRKRLDKYKDDKAKAREIYNDLQQQHSKLLAALDSSALALLEMDEQDMAGYTVKLNHSLGSFNLMTPDYSKLCSALNGYLSKLPVNDTPVAKNTNAAIIGRLMNNSKWATFRHRQTI